MEMFNIHAAKTHLSSLIEQVLAGEEIVIAKAGKPLVTLNKYETKRKPAKKKLKCRPLGKFKGQIWMSPDFDDEDPRILKMFGITDE